MTLKTNPVIGFHPFVFPKLRGLFELIFYLSNQYEHFYLLGPSPVGPNHENNKPSTKSEDHQQGLAPEYLGS